MPSATVPNSPRNALVEHCLELLSPLGTASAQHMFGGHGLRVDGVFIALTAFDRLYLKADAQSQHRFVTAGCEAFAYPAKTRTVALNYWTVPAEAMESPELMLPWARLALQAALRASTVKGKPRVNVARVPRRAARGKA